MKTGVAAVLILALCATTASAQYSTAKRLAREAENKINERHRSAEDGAPPPTPPTRPGLVPKSPTPGGPTRPGLPSQATPSAPTPPVAAAPVKPASQQIAAAKLKADIASAHEKGEATVEMQKQFVADLASAAQGRSRPSPAALDKLGNGLLPALAAKNVSLTGVDKLVKALIVSLNSAGLSPLRLQELNDEAQAVLTQAGVPAAEVAQTSQNLAAAVADIQSGAGK